ncbi:hypothetical protein [Streptococcus sp. ST16]|jgi:hypothetical protein|uniref:Uncharacterized protein n=1 Tax=Streptococcus oralis SK313 TaxID=1035190 RepID=F9PZS8_STROR|nr:hypothetical protein HMPREF9950_1869 [Streptococcus oralis SK313]
MQTFSYDVFKNEKGIVSFSEAEQIYSSLLNSSNQLDKEFQEEWTTFVLLCVEYTSIRGKWLTLSREEKLANDEARAVTHNKVIYQLKILKSLANEQSNDVTWFEKFNDDRKRIGDFACYVAYIYALNAR